MKNAFKAARDLFRSTGASLVLFLLAFGLAKDLVIYPVMTKIWSLTLKTTPDGYLTAGNLVSTLVRSPWVLLVGLLLLAGLVLLSLWQLCACILGAGYASQGRKPALKDLLAVSFRQLKAGVHKKNWVFPVYVLILLPLANVYLTSDLIGSITIPEYIEEYILIRPVLFIPFCFLLLGIAYLMFRWFYLLPSFVLCSQDFHTARRESLELTEKGWIKNGVRMAIYNLAEVIRIGMIPRLLIYVPVTVCYLCTLKMDFAAGVFNVIGIVLGSDLTRSIIGTFVTISIMCYLVANYRKRLEDHGKNAEFRLPDLTEREGKKRSVRKMLVLISLLVSVFVSGIYMAIVYGAKGNSGLITELFGTTEIIAHKGYSSKAPENTMPAFGLADACESVDMIELDVWSTKDGIPVVIHNETITEATGIHKNIYDCTWEELKKYPAVYNRDPQKFADARIPSLEEVLSAYCASTPLLIEIKGYPQDPELPRKIVDLVHEYDVRGECRIQSGDYDALRKVKEIDPDIPCGMILIAAVGSIYSMPYADFFSIEHSLITQTIVTNIHRHGKEIYAWTVNYSENADRLKFTGVDGLITDYPEDIDYYVSDANKLLLDAWRKEAETLFGNIFGGGAEKTEQKPEESDY